MGGRNPQNQAEANSFVAYVESLFMPWNIDALVSGFTQDCVVRFGILPEFRGQDALRIFFTQRMSRQKGYRLRKQFRSLMDNIITNVWDGEWEDTATGLPMRGYGVEVWTMRDGKIAVWEAAFNVGPAGKPADLSSVIG
jgi:nuclear transport factor 2 (NTF2) superfamily protein